MEGLNQPNGIFFSTFNLYFVTESKLRKLSRNLRKFIQNIWDISQIFIKICWNWEKNQLKPKHKRTQSDKMVFFVPLNYFWQLCIYHWDFWQSAVQCMQNNHYLWHLQSGNFLTSKTSLTSSSKKVKVHLTFFSWGEFYIYNCLQMKLEIRFWDKNFWMGLEHWSFFIEEL